MITISKEGITHKDVALRVEEVSTEKKKLTMKELEKRLTIAEKQIEYIHKILKEAHIL